MNLNQRTQNARQWHGNNCDYIEFVCDTVPQVEEKKQSKKKSDKPFWKKFVAVCSAIACTATAVAAVIAGVIKLISMFKADPAAA